MGKIGIHPQIAALTGKDDTQTKLGLLYFRRNLILKGPWEGMNSTNYLGANSWSDWSGPARHCITCISCVGIVLFGQLSTRTGGKGVYIYI